MRFFDTYRWTGWGLVLGIFIAIVGLVMLPPFVDEPLRTLIMQAFAGVCHQLPDRSPQVGGVALAVCDRCFGIYTGLVLGVLGFVPTVRWQAAVHRYAGVVMVGALVPLALDWVGPMLGWWANVPLSRAATGGFFGVAAGYLLARAATHIASRRPDAS